MARFRIASFVALLVACSAAWADGAPTTPTPITPTPVTPPEPETITITMVLPYPQDANVNRGIPGVTVTCTVGCEGQQTEVTDGQGVVAFTGRIPLTIQAEKSGYISVERGVSDGSRVAMGNEWPPETREAIRQLGLTNVVDSGELLLIWGDEEYFQGPSHGGEYNCSDAVMVRNWRGRDFMVNTLIHELMHAWQGRNSTRPPCDTREGWYPTESGQAWIAAIEKDLQEVGPIPGFDDDHSYGKPLSEVPQENQAAFYADWYMGTSWGRGIVTKAEFYRIAPNRSRYLEDRFGPPPRAGMAGRGGRTTPLTLDLTCHGYDEGATRAYNCIPEPSQQHHMRTFVPAVGSACDRGNIAEFPPGRIVFQIRCHDGSPGQSASWSYSGQGRDSFVKPVETPRVWVRTSFSGSSARLSVWCRAPQENLVVNELLGTSWGNDGTSGIYGMAGCRVVEVDTEGEDLQWRFTQELAATALTPPRLWERVTGAGTALGAAALQDLATAADLERLWRQPDRWRMNPGQGASTRGAVLASDDDRGARLGLRIASEPDDGTDALDGAVLRGAVRTSPRTLDLTCHGYDEGATRAYNCIPEPSQQRYMRTFVPAVGSACDQGSIAEFPTGRIVFQIRCRDNSSGQSGAWSYSGQGPAFFEKPVDTPRVWLRTSFSGSSVHLSVWCRAPQENLVVNELLGRLWGNDGTNGVYGMVGCREVEVDTGGGEDLQWWFTQDLAATALTPPRSWEEVSGGDSSLPAEARQDLATATELERRWSRPGR